MDAAIIKDSKKFNLRYFEIESFYTSVKKIASNALNITRNRSTPNVTN